VSPARPIAVVFDLDGTLVDSRIDLARAVNLVRGELGLEPLEIQAVLGMVGQGARNLVRRALGGGPDEELLDRALALFLERYEPICTERTRPYPGIPELIDSEFRRRPLAVLTNKPERPARRILGHFGWLERFGAILGGDSLAVRKPDPGGLLEIGRRLGVAPGRTLMVGDSEIDAATAAAAGSGFLFAAWGFAGAAERHRLSAARSADRPEQVAEWIARLDEEAPPLPQ
jgi:phosphoglycolate phosphatase